MINIKRKINKSDLNKELLSWLDSQFQTELQLRNQENKSEHTKFLKNRIKEWGEGFENNLPSELKDFFIYVTASADKFPYYNLNSKVLFKYIFPSFFNKFESGQIWIVETNEIWRDTAWSNEYKIARKHGIEERLGQYPHEFTGMKEEIFPEMSCDFAN